MGAKVVVNSRKQEAVDAVANDINTEGGTAIGVAGQVGNMEDCQKLFDATMAAFGRIDIVVNNACHTVAPPKEFYEKARHSELHLQKALKMKPIE